jgi:hypothetical protein
MKWYKLYLEAQIRGVISTAYAYSGPMRLRALVVLAFARRDAAANQLRSREEFYAELKRLSAVSSLTTVTIRHVDRGEAIPLIRVLRQLSQDKQAPFPSGLRECKDIYDQVRDDNPYTFKVRPQHRDAVVAKLRGAGAVVE